MQAVVLAVSGGGFKKREGKLLWEGNYDKKENVISIIRSKALWDWNYFRDLTQYEKEIVLWNGK